MLLVGGCAGVSVRRDLSETNPSDVVFNDLCGLQEYFDALKDSTLAPPPETFARDVTSDDGMQALGGRKRFRFENEFQLHYLRQVLENNWQEVPIEIAKASRVELEVTWSQKAGIPRVVTDEEALMSVGPKTWALPYHVCLSDLLFGEPLYDSRRAMLNLPDPIPSRFSTARREMRPVPPSRAEGGGPPLPASPVTASAADPGASSGSPPPPPPFGRIDVDQPGTTGRQPADRRPGADTAPPPGTPPRPDETQEPYSD